MKTKIITQLVWLLRKNNGEMTLDQLREAMPIKNRVLRRQIGQMINKNLLSKDDKRDIYILNSETTGDIEPEPPEEAIQQPQDNSEPSEAQAIPVPVPTPEDLDAGARLEEQPTEPQDAPMQFTTDIETQKKGLNAKMVDIEQKLDMALGVKEKKEKKSRLKKFSVGKLKRYNRKKSRAVILLSANQNAKLIKGEYIMGMIKVGENYYDGAALYTWLWEGKQPVYLVPEWSIRPIAAEEVLRRAKEEGTLIDSQIITIRAMAKVKQENEDATGQKKPANIMMFIGIALVIGVIAWLFLGGKKGG